MPDIEAHNEILIEPRPTGSSSSQQIGDPEFMSHARKFFAESDYEAAYEMAEAVLHTSPQNTEAQGIRAESLGHLNQPQRLGEALIHWNRVAPGPDPALRYANYLFENERDEECVDQILQILKGFELNPELQFVALKTLGNAHVRLGDFASAEECYGRAARIYPQSDILHVNQGTLEIQRGQYTEAAEFFRQALEINRRNARAWLGLALVHRHYGDLDLAWGNLESALDYDLRNEAGLSLLLDWGLKDGRLQSVERRLDQMIANSNQPKRLQEIRKNLLNYWGQA